MHATYQQLETTMLGSETEQEMQALCRWMFLVQWAVTLVEGAAKSGPSLAAAEAAAKPAKGKGGRKPSKAASRGAYEDEDDDEDDSGTGAKGGSSAAAAAVSWPAQKEAIINALRGLLKLPLGRVFHVTTERDALIRYWQATMCDPGCGAGAHLLDPAALVAPLPDTAP